MSRSKDKGTNWETTIVRFLRDNGVPHAERRALGGTLDRGDIAGIPGVVFEAKNASRITLSEWLAEAEAERANDHATYGIVWAKRTGKTSPADGYVIMTGAALVQLLTEAGYIAPPAGLPEPLRMQVHTDGSLIEALRDLIKRHDPPPPVRIDVSELGELCGMCHADLAITIRGPHKVCAECVDAWDYQASLTPEERRRDDEAQVRYVEQSARIAG